MNQAILHLLEEFPLNGKKLVYKSAEIVKILSLEHEADFISSLFEIKEEGFVAIVRLEPRSLLIQRVQVVVEFLDCLMRNHRIGYQMNKKK